MKVIKWLLLLPAALAGWTIADVVGDLWVEYIYGPCIPWQPISDFEKAFFPTAFAFASFVLVAAFVAPSHQRVVALVSSGVGAGLLTAILLTGMLLANSTERAVISWSGVLGTVAGAVVAFSLVIRAFVEENEPDPRRPRARTVPTASEPGHRQAELSLEEKAGELVDACRMFAGVISGKLRKDYPAFFSKGAEVFDRFIFFGTVACASCSCVRLHFEVEKGQRTPIENIVQRQLTEWHPEALDAYGEVHEFVTERLANEPDRSKRGELLFDLAASWVVESALEGQEAPCDAAVAHSFATQLVVATSGYWRSP